jgi:metal-responsive CopG/Arc/MetJ family transcriptional regulator
MKKINKNRISISIDKQLDDILNEEFNNKSKYIEWLIYQDMLKNSKNDKIKKLLI